jgi:hypothetical protein
MPTRTRPESTNSKHWSRIRWHATCLTISAQRTPSSALVGHSHDDSAYFRKIFPTLGSVDVPAVFSSRDERLSSTLIRERMFAHVLGGAEDRITPFHEMSDSMPPPVRRHLDRIWRTAPFRRLIATVRAERLRSA